MCTFLAAGSSFGFAKKDLKQKVACLAEVACSAVYARAPQHLLWKLTSCAVAVVQRETLEQIAPKLPTLNEVVAADKKASRLLHVLLPRGSIAEWSCLPPHMLLARCGPAKNLIPAWGMDLAWLPCQPLRCSGWAVEAMPS